MPPLTLKEKQDFRIATDDLVATLRNSQTLTFKSRQYTVHRMNYGDFFLEPVGWKGGEMDGFASGTLWLRKVAGRQEYVINID